MKKLLIFMLVLGLVSAANAVTITFTSPGLDPCPHGVGADFDVLAGETYVVQIISDTVLTSSMNISITETSTSAAGDATAVATGGTLDPTFTVNPQVGNVRNMLTNQGAPVRYILI